MNIIACLAERILESQSFEYNSFNDAIAIVEHPFRTKTLRIKYDRFSLNIYNHNLTSKQYWTLGKSLNKWLDSHNSEAQKKRIEYGILKQYALVHPEFLQARVEKAERPDFVLELDGQTIGIEVTRLERESDSIMTKIISEYNKPGMRANEILDIAFKKHGCKAKEYRLLEFEEGAIAIQHVDNMLISSDVFVDQIIRKIEKYRLLAPKFDKFIILCNAQKGITITSENDALNMINDILGKSPDFKVNIAIMYLTAGNELQCVEHCPD
jgi:hypothetical protein